MHRKNLLKITLSFLSIFVILELNMIPLATGRNTNYDAQEQDINNNISNMVVVDKNGHGDYIKIQDAIDNAKGEDTIYIRSGEYREMLTINKKINLVGENRETTIINPTSEKNGYAIRIMADGVTIDQLSISNKGSGIYTTGVKIIAQQVTIKNCKLYSVPVGIALWSSNNIISNCIFWNCEDEGIAFLGSNNRHCSNNLVVDSTFYNNCDGIELQYSSDNIISNCEFYKNTHAGIDAIGSSNSNNIVLNCNIYENEAFGIYLSSGSKYNTISDCSISKNKDENIVMDGDQSNNVVKNQRYGNSYAESHQSLRSFFIHLFLSFFKNLKNKNY